MVRTHWFPKVLLTASLCALVSASAAAQGKGKGGGDDKDKGKGRAPQSRSQVRGNDAVRDAGKPNDVPKVVKNDARDDKNERKETRSEQKIERKTLREFEVDGKDDKDWKHFRRQVVITDLRPSLQRFFVTDKRRDRVVAGAVARAHLRGLSDDVFVITPTADRVRILNKSGVVLVDLDDDRADKLGRWEVLALNDNVKEGAPAFCRSGEGHPVWGREWCLDKGFGLGAHRDGRWGHARELDDVVFLQPVNTTGLIAHDALRALLSPVAYDRLALHAITLGLVEPLVGRWMGEPTGSQVLLVSSGALPVAELVDVNRDNRADRMVVALRSW